MKPVPKGIGIIEEVMGPTKAAPDANEADGGGEGELETHLRAWQKAMRGGDMSTAAASFRAAVNACSGSMGGYEDSGPESSDMS